MKDNVTDIARAYGVEPGRLATGMTSSEAFAMGMEAESKRRSQAESASVRTFASKVTELISRPGSVTQDEARSTPGTWAGFNRAVEHLVTDLNPETAATPHGVWEMGAGWVLALTETWMTAAMPSLKYATLVEAPTGQGIPQLPVMETPPTAGPQGGEKTEGYSKALSVVPNEGSTYIDSTLYLNVSELVLETPGALPVLNALLSSAVAHEANRQVAAAMQAGGGTASADLGAAFSTFNGGRFVPNTVVIPPSAVMSIEASNLAAAGIQVVVDPSVSVVMVCSKDATVGWYKPIRVQAMEPSAFGQQVGYQIAGRVGVDPAGVATVTAA